MSIEHTSPEPHEDPDLEEFDLEQLEEIEQNPSNEALKKLGYAAAAIAVGGAAYFLYRKGKRRMNTPDGGRLIIGADERKLPGIVSLVQISGKKGGGKPTDLSLSLPVGQEVIDKLAESNKTTALFAMQAENPAAGDEHRGIAFPLKGKEHEKVYSRALGTAAKWVLGAVSSSKKKE